MNYLSVRSLGMAMVMVFLIPTIACSGGFDPLGKFDAPKRLEIDVTGWQTLIGPQVADPIEVFLSETLGSDYKVNLSCRFKNIGQSGTFNVEAMVYQGDNLWERRRSVHSASGQSRTLEIVFNEPVFDDWASLSPFAQLVPGYGGMVASTLLAGQTRSEVGGNCRVSPSLNDMKMRLECAVSNHGEGSGIVTVRGVRNGTSQTQEINIGPNELQPVVFEFEIRSVDDRFGCEAEW